MKHFDAHLIVGNISCQWKLKSELENHFLLFIFKVEMNQT